MLKLLIEKELRAILFSPKFAATFAVCAILLLLSVFIGINEYNTAMKQYETARSLADQELREQTSYMSLGTRVFRQPDPMQIFVAGVHNDIGRLSGISSSSEVKLTNSIYSDDPIYAVFRFIDFAFIFQIVLSLFAILFTYDAINGERETGTLQLTFANAIPRAHYILAKFAGTWLGLLLPLLVPILLALLLVLLYGVPLQGEHWGKIAALLGVSLLYFTFFIVFGILVSALTRRSSTSFLFALVTWVVFVLIVPRAGVMLAGQLVPVPSVAEIEGKRNAFEKARWQQHMDEMAERWRQRNSGIANMTPQQREAFRDEHSWEWMKEDEKARKLIEEEIGDYSRRLNEELRNRKAVQERLGFLLSRFSPASAYQLAASSLAGTNIDLKDMYEAAMQDYRKAFRDFRERKMQESGGSSGVRIMISSDGGFQMSGDRSKGTLDLAGMPQFAPPQHTLAAGLVPSLADFGLLAIYSLLAFAGAFRAFLRYDVR